MPILSKGTTYATGDQVTASGLNALVDSATFASGAVDSSTTTLSGGAIIVKDGGVTMAKLASASNGQIPIGNGSGFTAATLTAGTNIGITNASGAVTVAFSGTLPIANGGTGAVTAAAARTALEIGGPIRCTADVNVIGETYSDITGMTANVVSGTTYTLETSIRYTAATGAANLKLTGTATASYVVGYYKNFTASSVACSDTGTALPITISSFVGETLEVAVTFVCNGSGTIKWQIAGNAPTRDVTAKQGSYMKLLAY